MRYKKDKKYPLLKIKKKLFIISYFIVIIFLITTWIWRCTSINCNICVFVLIFGSVSVFLFLLLWIPWYLINGSKSEHINISGDILVYFPPKNSGERQKEFNLKDYVEILWERETFEFTPGSRSNLYLVTREGERHPLTIEKLDFFFRLDHRLLEALAASFDLEIKIKNYWLHADLRGRHEK